MRRLLAIPLVTVCLLGAVNLRAQSANMTYDTFMELDANARLETFPKLTPENCAALLREQAVRWRRVNAERVTLEQDLALAEAATFNRPENYIGSSRHSSEEVAAILALEAKISKMFTPEDSFEAFTLRGRHLPAQ